MGIFKLRARIVFFVFFFCFVEEQEFHRAHFTRTTTNGYNSNAIARYSFNRFIIRICNTKFRTNAIKMLKARELLKPKSANCFCILFTYLSDWSEVKQNDINIIGLC